MEVDRGIASLELDEVTCNCLDLRHEERERKRETEEGQDSTKEDPWHIPASIKKLVIHSTHGHGGIRIGNVIQRLRKGFNVYCLCNLRKLQRKWALQTPALLLQVPMGAAIFQHMVRVKTVRRNTAFFIMYNKVHTCSSPPPTEQDIPTLRELAYVGAVAGGLQMGYHTEDGILGSRIYGYLRQHLPNALIRDFPQVITYGYTLVCHHPHFIEDVGDSSMTLCRREHGHGRL